MEAQLQERWLQLFAALAWVAKRDPQFMYAIKKHGPEVRYRYEPNTDESDWSHDWGDESSFFTRKEEDDAWTSLRTLIVNGQIAAQGVPYKELRPRRFTSGPIRKGALTAGQPGGLSKSANSVGEPEQFRVAQESRADLLAEEDDEDEGEDADFVPPQHKPLAAEAGRLVVSYEFGQLHLRPEMLAFEDGWRWRRVEISQEDLLKNFATRNAVVPVSPETSRTNKRAVAAALLREIESSMDASHLTPGQIYREVHKRAAARGLDHISDQTIRRAAKARKGRGRENFLP